MIFTKDDVYDVLDDIERVETQTGVLQSRVLQILSKNLPLVIKSNWTRSDFIYASDMERIRSNIESICKAISNDYNIPRFEKFDYKNANSFEEALEYASKYLTTIIEILSQPRAGTYYSNTPLMLIGRNN